MKTYSVTDILQEKFQISFEEKIERFAGMKVSSYQIIKAWSILDQPVDNTLVDVVIKATMEDLVTEWFELFFIFDLRPCQQAIKGPLVRKYRKTEYIGIRLSEYMIPIIPKEYYDGVATWILQQYYPEALQVPTPIDGYEMARRMGLRVIETEFSLDSNDLGRLQLEGTQTVRPGSILINSRKCKDYVTKNGTVIHELVHMNLDRHFFLLQMMAGNKSYRYLHCSSEKMGFCQTPTDWMERHAEKMTAHLLMEENMTRKCLEEWIAGTGGRRSIGVMQMCLERLTETFKVSKGMAKIRMIELGYKEAEGIYNFSNGKYIPPYQCDEWKDYITYDISFRDLLVAVKKDTRLQELVCSNNYRYVEGHYCNADDKYICVNADGRYHLTAYGRTHVDECCVPFSTLRDGKKSDFNGIYAARNETIPNTTEYKVSHHFKSQEDKISFLKDAALWQSVIEEMPGSFGDSLLVILEKKGITREALANRLGVDRKNIYKMIKGKALSLSHVVGVCMALEVPFYIAQILINKAGRSLSGDGVAATYSLMLQNAGTITIEECNELLEMSGYGPFFQAGQKKTA